MSTAVTAPVAAPEPGDGAHPQGAARRPSADLRHDAGRRRGSSGWPSTWPRRSTARPCPLRRLVGRRRPRRRRRRRCPTRGTRCKALEAILAAPGKGFYLLKDFPTHDGRPEIVRRLRDLYRALKDRGRHVLLVSPRLAIPEDVKKEIYVVEYELPDDNEIAQILDGHLRRRLGSAIDEPAHAPAGARDARPDGRRDRPRRLQGLRRAQDASTRPAFLEVLAEKEQMSTQGGRARVRAARASRSTTSAATRS